MSRSVRPETPKKRKPVRFALTPATTHGHAWFEVSIADYHPARLNQLLSLHWARAQRLKDADAELIAAELYRAGVTAATGKRRVRLVIVLGPGQRGADPDAYNKSFMDALARSGAITDDNRQGVELMPVEYERQSIKGCRIILEDLS